MLSCLGLGLLLGAGAAAQTTSPQAPDTPTPAARTTAVFTKEFLNDPKTVDQGRKVFQERCVFCHGKTAYPGKAPKLTPSRYTPDFVYDRVTNGFRAMPPFNGEFNEEQRRAVAAYIVSKEFSN